MYEIGQIIYYLDSNEMPQKTTVKNIDTEGKYINLCECEDCMKRIGTDTEHYRYDNAIHFNNVFETKEVLIEMMIQDVYWKVDRI